MTRDSTIEINIPPITAMASGCSICEPAPQAKAKGSMPAMVASAVMTIGRNRRRLACSIASSAAEDAMLQASRRRLRPIVMTALATMAGMLPLAFAWGAGSQMLQPLAIAVIGGILISMVLSLVITPAVHYYLSHEETSAEVT